MAGGIRSDLPIGFLGQERRHCKELEIVERCESLPLDDRSALRLEPDGDARPAELRPLMAKRAAIGGVMELDHPRFQALSGNSLHKRFESLAMRETAERGVEVGREG